MNLFGSHHNVLEKKIRGAAWIFFLPFSLSVDIDMQWVSLKYHFAIIQDTISLVRSHQRFI